MQMVQAIGTQQNVIVVKSYPDSGYFVIWEDSRTTANGVDIYAQKYDKNGTALWAENGIPVVARPDDQRIVLLNTTTDYRYQEHACTDSAIIINNLPLV